MAKTIKMTKGDKSADVHPDEVANMAAAGWIKAKKPVKKKGG